MDLLWYITGHCAGGTNFGACDEEKENGNRQAASAGDE
jgi:hypothetical protein